MDRNALGYLADLNRNVEGALALLEKLAEYPELNNEYFIIFQSYFREHLADANMIVLDALEESEQGHHAQSKQRTCLLREKDP